MIILSMSNKLGRGEQQKMISQMTNAKDITADTSLHENRTFGGSDRKLGGVLRRDSNLTVWCGPRAAVNNERKVENAAR